MSEENRSDQYTPGHKPDMKTLFKDNRVKGIAGIAAIAVIWAIMAQSNSGTHQERVEALEGQLASVEQENTELSQRLSEVEQAETDLTAMRDEMASLEQQ